MKWKSLRWKESGFFPSTVLCSRAIVNEVYRGTGWNWRGAQVTGFVGHVTKYPKYNVKALWIDCIGQSASEWEGSVFFVFTYHLPSRVPSTSCVRIGSSISDNCLAFLPELPRDLNEVKYAKVLRKIANVKQVLFRCDSLYSMQWCLQMFTVTEKKKLDSLFN